MPAELLLPQDALHSPDLPQIREEAPRPVQPVGPQNYNDVIRREQEAAQAPAAAPPAAVAPPPPKKQPAEDLSGLY